MYSYYVASFTLTAQFLLNVLNFSLVVNVIHVCIMCMHVQVHVYTVLLYM